MIILNKENFKWYNFQPRKRNGDELFTENLFHDNQRAKTASTSKMERIVIPLQWYSTEANAATLARKGYFTKIWRYCYNNNRYPKGSNDVALVRSHK